MRKILSALIVLFYIFNNVLSIAVAVNTDGKSSPWTREKAMHLAEITLFNSSKTVVDSLFAAGSASAAVNMIFPNATGPDRTEFNSYIANYTGSGFNWGDANHTTRLYQLMYASDPYEGKRKLFSLFEDIFSVNRDTDRDITYKDVYELHELLFNNMLGNYQVLVKKVLNNNGSPGDYAAGKFLDLFNQKDPKNPNENFARELLQLFLMNEYEPFESKENNDIRNYEESDVKSLSRLLTGFKADAITHQVTFDITKHFSGSTLAFLSGSIPTSFPYYNSASGTIDPIAILTPVNGNNGLQDNVIEYIFAQRSDAIALFLADRIARFYISDTPTRSELDAIAQIIKNNNFNILPSLKEILVLDMVYSDASMNSIRYKNPLELAMGTIRMMRGNTFSGIVIDPNVYDTNLLRRVGWTPYFPGSIFGRDGFDDSLKWSSTSTQSAWMTASNYFTYRTTGTGALDFLSMLGSQKKEITTGNVSVMTHTNNSYTGSMMVIGGSLDLGNPIASVEMLSVLSVRELSIEEQILANGYPLDPIESILGGENLDLFKSEIYQWLYNEDSFIPANDTVDEILPIVVYPVPENISTGTLDTASGVEEKVEVIVDSGSIITTPEVIGTTEEVNTGVTASEPVDVSIASFVGTTEVGNSGDVSEASTGVSVDPVSSSGEIVVDPVVESGSLMIDDPVIVVDSGATNSGEEIVIPEVMATEVIIPVNAVGVSTGYVTFPNFKIVTDLGTITVSGGTYNADTHTLLIHSGFIMQNGSGTQILSGTIIFDPSSKLIADTIQPNEIIDTYENYLYGEKRLSSDVRTTLVDFLTKDLSGALMPVAPTNTMYFNKYIRGLLSILLSQPEYVLLHGYDKATIIDDSEQHFLDNVTGKLFFIELYGGNDYMTSIIPKDEYSTYLDYRSNQTGSIAITGSGLVDIGDFYMNSALAYGSGGGPGFKSLYDQGYLKIFNRVGGYKHSNDHDAAAKQITSYDSSTSISAEGAFGHLVKKEFESSHTISLGSKLPNIYRAGHFVNLGGSVILTNPLDQGGQLKSHMDTMVKITMARSFPGNTRNLFKDAGRISEIGKTSVAQGGPGGASGDMNSVFKFAKVLLNNNIGRSFYMGGYGGYDTHGDQFTGLNKNLNFVSTAVTTFFNEVKDTQDVTIVIFSEFGRTNKTNGDLGTDHGDGGGMYVLTSNANLRSMLQAGTYGNMSIKNAKYNSLGIGVDYRSVYGSIFSSLYGLDPSTYFGTGISLANDISLTPNTISLLNYSYQASGNNPLLNVELTVTGSNFNPGKSGYTRLLSGTGILNPKITRLNEKIVPGGYRYTFQINPNTQPYYSVESFSNQYAVSGFSGTLTGATRPLVLANNIREISQVKTSILPMFGNTTAPSKLAGTGIIIENTGSNILTIADNSQIRIHFGSGITNVTDLTYTSGSTTWRGGFTLGEKIDRELFIPSNAIIVSDNKTLQKQNITHLFKIGADIRGVGMKLNQSVGIEFVGLPVGETYRAVSSQDGISWDDVESAGKLYQSSSTGSVYVNTDHFSYFALVSNNAIEVSPTCTISANPASVTNGSGTILTWSLLNTLTGTLNPGNILLGVSGSLSVIPPSNTTTPYTISVINSSGSNSCTVSVTASVVVVPPPVVLPPTCTIIASPTSVTNGSSTLLSWTLVNVQTGTLSPGNTLLGVSGSLSVIPPSNATTPYVISVTNSAGSNSCTVSVTASAVVVPPPPPVVLPPTCTISANPTSVTNGSSTLLTWSIFNTLTGTLSPGNTIVGSSGSISVLPSSNTTTIYSIGVTNGSGSSSCSVSVTASAVVVPPPVVLPPTCTISASPTSVTNGLSTLLSWTLTNVQTGTLNPGNILLGVSGSLSVIPLSNTTTPYTISVINSSGSNSCTTSVTASAVVVPPVVPPVTPSPVISGPGGPSGGGGSSVVIRSIDTCLGGDFSGNYYDGLCTSPNTSIVPVTNPPVESDVVYVPVSLPTLISDLEGTDAKYVDAATEQRIRSIALDIWRNMPREKNAKISSARATIAQLDAIIQQSNNRAVKTTLSRVISILDQFIEQQGVSPDIQNISTSTEGTEPDTFSQISDSLYKYVSAERSVTFRKSAYVGLSNILGYLSRNTQVSIIAEEVNGWTKVLYDGVEGYIKSSYLRDQNSADLLRSGGALTGNEQRGYITAKQNAYMRATPYLSSRIVAVVYRNQSVVILDSISGWYEVLLENGIHGYIRKELISTLDSTW